MKVYLNNIYLGDIEGNQEAVVGTKWECSRFGIIVYTKDNERYEVFPDQKTLEKLVPEKHKVLLEKRDAYFSAYSEYHRLRAAYIQEMKALGCKYEYVNSYDGDCETLTHPDLPPMLYLI